MKTRFPLLAVVFACFVTGCSQLGFQSPSRWSEEMLSGLTLWTDDAIMVAGGKGPQKKEIIFSQRGGAGWRPANLPIVGYFSLSWQLDGDWLILQDVKSNTRDELRLRHVGHRSITAERRDGATVTFTYYRVWTTAGGQKQPTFAGGLP